MSRRTWIAVGLPVLACLGLATADAAAQSVSAATDALGTQMCFDIDAGSPEAIAVNFRLIAGKDPSDYGTGIEGMLKALEDSYAWDEAKGTVSGCMDTAGRAAGSAVSAAFMLASGSAELLSVTSMPPVGGDVEALTIGGLSAPSLTAPGALGPRPVRRPDLTVSSFSISNNETGQPAGTTTACGGVRTRVPCNARMWVYVTNFGTGPVMANTMLLNWIDNGSFQSMNPTHPLLPAGGSMWHYRTYFYGGSCEQNPWRLHTYNVAVGLTAAAPVAESNTGNNSLSPGPYVACGH